MLRRTLGAACFRPGRSLLLFLAATIGCDTPTAAHLRKLSFTAQPTGTMFGQVLLPAVQVEIRDAAGVRVANAQDAVTLALSANSAGAIVQGSTTVDAENGIATFRSLFIDKAGTDLTLVASAGNLAVATSAPFAISGPSGPLNQVSAGHYDNACGITATGAVYCWGFNAKGELGDGSTANRSRPVLVRGGVNFAAVSSGTLHTCAVTTAGAAYCWGANSYGQLGDGTTTDGLTPVLVTGGLTFDAVSAGYDHTCAVTTTRITYCWGANGSGQLGDGTTIDRSTPTLVTGEIGRASCRERVFRVV